MRTNKILKTKKKRRKKIEEKKANRNMPFGFSLMFKSDGNRTQNNVDKMKNFGSQKK